jgi:phosphate-selective porin
MTFRLLVVWFVVLWGCAAADPFSQPVGQDVQSAPDTPASEPLTTAPEAKTTGFPQFRFQGQIQLQADDGELGSARATSPFPVANGLGLFPADSRLFVRRFRPSLGVAFSPHTDLQTEFNIAPQTQRFQILDVRFNHDLSEDTYLSLGRYKVPFGWEGVRSSRTTNTIERSDMTVALYPERDVGLSATHRQHRLGHFSLGAFLGQPRSNGGTNGGLDVIGRGVFLLNDSLQVGVSGHTGTYRPGGLGNDLPVRRLGTEARFTSGPWKIESEVMWSDGYNSVAMADTRAFGYYATALYRVSEPLEFVLSYDRFDPDLEASDPVRGRNQVNARDRKVVGLNYQITGNVDQRFMLNYEWRDELEGGQLRTQGWRARYQLSW